MNHHIARWHSLTLSPADRAILDQMEEEMDSRREMNAAEISTANVWNEAIAVLRTHIGITKDTYDAGEANRPMTIAALEAVIGDLKMRRQRDEMVYDMAHERAGN